MKTPRVASLFGALLMSAGAAYAQSSPMPENTYELDGACYEGNSGCMNTPYNPPVTPTSSPVHKPVGSDNIIYGMCAAGTDCVDQSPQTPTPPGTVLVQTASNPRGTLEDLTGKTASLDEQKAFAKKQAEQLAEKLAATRPSVENKSPNYNNRGRQTGMQIVDAFMTAGTNLAAIYNPTNISQTLNTAKGMTADGPTHETQNPNSDWFDGTNKKTKKPVFEITIHGAAGGTDFFSQNTGSRPKS